MGIEIHNQKVRFTIRTEAGVNTVSIAGTFNHWDNKINYLSQTSPGVWQVDLDIEDGRHFYKYILNDTRWENDPENHDISEDAQNNSSFTKYRSSIYYRQTNSQKNPGYLWKHEQSRKSPKWLHEAVIYELNIRQFSTSGFKGMKEKLPYLQKLGVNTLWIMPVFEVSTKNKIGKHGDPYATKEYYALNPEYGSQEELKDFIDAAHHKNMKIIIDWTINRMGADASIAKEHPEWFTSDDRGELYYKIPGRNSFIGFNFNNKELREYIINALIYWIHEYSVDGFRFDDTDITPLDFLDEIRAKIDTIKKDLIIISQAYNELHHINFCDMTYEGGIRQMLIDIIHNKKTADDLRAEYDKMVYSFPKKSLRMRWLDEKEQPRLHTQIPYETLYPVVAIHLTLDNIPFLLMGEEFNDKNWNTYTSLFDDFVLDWENADKNMFEHYRKLIDIRLNNKAFCYGSLEFIDNGNESLISYKRNFENTEFLVFSNLGAAEKSIALSEQDFDSSFTAIFGENECSIKNNILSIPGYKSVILKKI